MLKYFKNHFYNLLKYGIWIIPLFFVFPFLSHATTVTLYDNSNGCTSGGYYNCNTIGDYLGGVMPDSFVATGSGPVSKLEFWGLSNGTYGTISNIQILDVSNNVLDTSPDTITLNSSTDYQGDGNLHYFIVNFNNVANLSSGSTYKISWTDSGALFLGWHGTDFHDIDWRITSILTSPTVSLITPTPSSTISDFSHWKFNYNTKDYGGSYMDVKIKYGYNSSLQYTDTYGIYSTLANNTSSTDYLLKSNPLFSTATSSPIYYELDLNGLTSTMASSSGIFYVYGSYTTYTGSPADYTNINFYTTTTNQYGVYMATSTCPSADLFSSSTLSAIGCQAQNFVANIINFFVSGFYSAADKIMTILSNVKYVFPINIFYTINNDFQSAQTNLTDNNVIISTHGSITYSRSYTILSSSTADFVDNHINFDYRTLIDNVLYTMTGAIMVFVSVGLLKKLHDENKQS